MYVIVSQYRKLNVDEIDRNRRYVSKLSQKNALSFDRAFGSGVGGN